MLKLWNKAKCWSRGNHEWKLHWQADEASRPDFFKLVASSCLRCGKHRAA